MKRIPSYTKICAALSFAALAMSGSPLRASITNITHTNYVMDSITIDGTVYLPGDIALGQLDSVQPDSSTAAIGEIRPPSASYDAGGGFKANIDAAASSLIIGTSALNVEAGSLFQFGRTIQDSDVLFLLEYGPGETSTQTFELVDGSGSVIGSYTYDFTGSDFTDNLATWSNGISFRRGGQSTPVGTVASLNTLGGLSFSLADFGVAPGTVTTATGIRYQNAGGFDTTMAGLVTVPEPSTLLLMLTFSSVMLLLRRRR